MARSGRSKTPQDKFRAEAHRQSAAVAASEHEARDQAFIDVISVSWQRIAPC
jgi:hypothetical protein